MSVLSVSQLATLYGTTPQFINKAVREGLKSVSEHPRMIESADWEAWMSTHTTQKVVRETVRKEAATTKERTQKHSLILEAAKHEKVMMWDTKKNGWCIAVPTEKCQPFADNYIEYIKHNGKDGVARNSNLVNKAKAGELFFVDPDNVVAFLLGQLKAVNDRRDHAQLSESIATLEKALEQLKRYKSTYVSNFDVDTAIDQTSINEGITKSSDIEDDDE